MSQEAFPLVYLSLFTIFASVRILSGLDTVAVHMPAELRGKRVGILCHSSSITSDFRFITEVFGSDSGTQLRALFGPQHGISGQTQDNMIEWEGTIHPVLGIPVYSLYGEHRKPTQQMLRGLDVMVADLQDVGARLYTYIWTVKLCMEACAEAGIPFYILDRPNPIGKVQADGPVLLKEYFTFVGGASIPLCHRMTIGEMAVWIGEKHIPGCDLHVIRAEGWRRNTLYHETGLPWVLPSPNMPTPQTALVYPGTVLAETLNLSEGRGTVIPFEITGAPFIESESLLKELRSRKLKGCSFRIHDFIPTFHKFAGQYCKGIQIHVTDASVFRPVACAMHLFDAIIKTSPEGSLSFNPPPYEYEYRLMPFDILAGDSGMREVLERGLPLDEEIKRWDNSIREFTNEFGHMALYPE
ncbi:MAG: DUF1343 domain-containing protein [Bacteroidales bacterium]|jgi:uncharacterized protein YbbC (DUF1343 family)|nr:DUF1343 domain-containing protein [Bacteroidales bacterium]